MGKEEAAQLLSSFCVMTGCSVTAASLPSAHFVFSDTVARTLKLQTKYTLLQVSTILLSAS